MTFEELLKDLQGRGLEVTERKEPAVGNMRCIEVAKLPIRMGALSGQEPRVIIPVPVADGVPPPGFHLKPRLGKGRGTPAVHDGSPFGTDWEYWSRPFNEWRTTGRNAGAILSHFNRVMQNA